MRFLVDECTGPQVANWLRSEGYDVFSAYDEARGATDVTLLEKAHADNYILITNDRDFGEMVHRDAKPHHGVIFLRLADERPTSKIAVISLLL